MAEHRVELVQLLDLCLNDGGFDFESLCHLRLALGILREELMQRRIEQPNRDRQSQNLELYDVNLSPDPLLNVADRHPEVVRRLAKHAGVSVPE